MVKKFIVTASILAFGLTSQAFAQVDLFKEIPPSSWEYQTLKDLHTRGVLKGLKEEQFTSNRTLTAYEAAMAVVQSLSDLNKLIADGGEINVKKGDVLAMLEVKDSFKSEIAKIDERLWDIEDDVELNAAELEGLKERVHVLENKAKWFAPRVSLDVRTEFFDATEMAAEYNATDYAGLPAGTPVTLKQLRKRDVNNDSNMKLRMRFKFDSEVDDDVTLTGQFTTESNFGRVANSGTKDARFPASEGEHGFDVQLDQAFVRWDINKKLALVAGRTQATIGKGLVIDTQAPRSALHGISATFDYFGDYVLWASYDRVVENADYNPLAKALVNDPVEDNDIDALLLYVRGPFFSEKNEVGMAYVYAPTLPKYATVPGALAAAADKLLADAQAYRNTAAGLVATSPDGAATLRGQADLFETKAAQLQNLMANRTLMNYYPDVPGGLAFPTDDYSIGSFWVNKGIGRFRDLYFEFAKNFGAESSADTAWQLGLDWGKNFRVDDWSFHAKYRRAESQSIVPGLSLNYLDSHGYGPNRSLLEFMYQRRVTPRMDLGLGMKWVRSLDPYIVATDPFTIGDDMKMFSVYGFMNAFF